ncbi:hypothetical protein MMC10_007653 [Thelotrema lepadinum]|nr:hypothetical protein [Thelotrema lepadinum]
MRVISYNFSLIAFLLCITFVVARNQHYLQARDLYVRDALFSDILHYDPRFLHARDAYAEAALAPNREFDPGQPAPNRDFDPVHAAAAENSRQPAAVPQGQPAPQMPSAQQAPVPGTQPSQELPQQQQLKMGDSVPGGHSECGSPGQTVCGVRKTTSSIPGQQGTFPMYRCNGCKALTPLRKRWLRGSYSN